MLQKSWELAVARVAVLRHPVASIASVGHLASISHEDQKAA